jgi:hypothetical protein
MTTARKRIEQMLRGNDEWEIILDDLVHEEKAHEASAINNGGPAEQIEYLIAALGETGAEDAVRQALKGEPA